MTDSWLQVGTRRLGVMASTLVRTPLKEEKKKKEKELSFSPVLFESLPGIIIRFTVELLEI